jgi:tetratricopeptide (TPR) repeat protein
MSSDPPTAYENLTPEQAAEVDAVCDRFERAWKATKSGGPVPLLASYLDGSHGPQLEILSQELAALDRACRQRYDPAAHSEPSRKRDAADVDSAAATNLVGQRAAVPASRLLEWPSIPGLEFLEVLGSGGMGVVFKARQATLDRDVAVKFLRDDHRADPGRRERFLQEARAVARLRHPHLVQVYEFGEVPGSGGATSHPYLVLEYVPGGSLVELLRGSPQPPAEAARLVETLADAIHYAHQQGVIHRDLKPANVLLQRAQIPRNDQTAVVRGPRPSAPTDAAELCAKITDFGLAKLLSGSDLTHSGEVLGTPSYMAPEQATGKSGPITAAVDVYGLGAILYEDLTGRPPFAAATVEATLGLVRRDEPVPPRRLQPTVPRDLETICLKCLRKEPGRRYATAQDLADDLRHFRAGEPIRARPVGTVERVVIWCRRNPRVAGLVAALVLVFLTGCAGILWQWQRATSNADTAERNASAFRRERDTARQEKERAERNLQMVRNRVDQLNQLGRDLLGRPGQFRTGQAVLEQALAFYQEMLPVEGNDPKVRLEAARLFNQVAHIHLTLGQAAKAAEAFDRQASLLASLLEEEPGSKALRLELAYSRRWQANALRDMAKASEAREAYDQAADLQQGLLDESPNEPQYQMALANTLLNKATLFSRREQAEELGPLFQRIVELDRAAVRAKPDDRVLKGELALSLGAVGLFYLETGRATEAEATAREAVEIHKDLLDSGDRRSSTRRYAARNNVSLGRVLAAAGQTEEAEHCYKQAVSLLDRLVAELPESAQCRSELAETLAGLAGLLDTRGRRKEAEEDRRRAIRTYEALRTDFPEDPQHRRDLVTSYLQLVSHLWEVGRQSEATEQFNKALELDPEDSGVNEALAWFLSTNAEPRLRDAGLAVRLAQKAVDARPQSAAYRNTLGVAHYRNGDDKAALAELKVAISLRNGGNCVDWFFLSMAYGRLGDGDQARTWLDRAVKWMDKHNPKDVELRRFRAEAEAMLTEAPKP